MAWLSVPRARGNLVPSIRRLPKEAKTSGAELFWRDQSAQIKAVPGSAGCHLLPPGLRHQLPRDSVGTPQVPQPLLLPERPAREAQRALAVLLLEREWAEDIPLEVTSCLQSPILYLTVCTICNAKQPQFPQPLLIRLLLQTLHQLRCPSLDTLQHLNVSLVVRGPKLNTVVEVRPHQCRVQGHDHSPSPAGHATSDTSQDAIGFLGHLGTLLAHIQLAVNQHPQVLFCQAAFQPLFPKPVALHGVAVAQLCACFLAALWNSTGLPHVNYTTIGYHICPQSLAAPLEKPSSLDIHTTTAYSST
ncbi:hypothetical protein QYF61_016486 [Mycteria americana]|uniref:Uncharacterized protein n=1 Tax=Mycteria americana TaxID=33587 RepID=A0AAN7NTP4_MYCAM|nr:hypothetical protein QYF61_016486 [Mycteria americana]